MTWCRNGNRLPAALGLSAAALALAGPARADDVVRVGGTGTAIGVMRRLGSAFERAHPGDRLFLPPSLGSSGAVKAALSGAIDVGVSGRAARREERAQAIRDVPFARTLILFAAGPRSGAKALRTEELVRILRGETEAWPGGERIRLVLRPHNDSDTQDIRSISPEMAAAVDVALARPGVLVAATNQECEEAVSRTPGALGATTLLQLRTEGRAMTPLAWNGVEPTPESLAAGAYPLVKTIHLIVPGAPRPAARRFLAFLASEEARRILREAGAEPVPFSLPE